MRSASRIAGIVASALMVAAGLRGMADLWQALSAGAPRISLSATLLALGLIVLGAGGFLYIRRGYRGGPYTIFGALFVFVGIYFVALAIERSGLRASGETVIDFLGAAFEMAGGVLLLRAGMERNDRLSRSESGRAT